MNLKEAAQHCAKAWGQYAERFQIKRTDEFYLFKMQEELGELVRAFLELRGSEKKRKLTEEELKKKFAGDCASLVGNALILAQHFGVDLEKELKEKFPVQ
jgi:NTP pyrophosphatase (non-canonical NTP hydrolase)